MAPKYELFYLLISSIKIEIGRLNYVFLSKMGRGGCKCTTIYKQAKNTVKSDIWLGSCSN